MPENCNQNDCPLVPRVEALERANAVQDAHYRAIDAKLDELTVDRLNFDVVVTTR